MQKFNFDFNNSYLQILFNDRDFSDTWEEHGGLSGHVDHAKRKIIRRDRELKDKSLLEEVLANQGEHPTLEVILKNTSELLSKIDMLGASVSGAYEYFLLSGFSRSGGTYALSEYAKMRGVDISKQHITFSHDFSPAFEKATFESKEEEMRKMLPYFGGLLTHHQKNHQDSFFKRSSFGAIRYPYYVSLANTMTGLRFFWRHTVRDLHGTMHSLKKMYSEEDIVNNLAAAYQPRVILKTEFGILATLWFMSNTTVLPTVKDLPFWDKQIDTSKSINHYCDDIRFATNRYIKKYGGMNYYEIGKPRVIKFGSGMEEGVNRDIQFFHEGSSERAGKFNYKPAVEIDDPYCELYECLLVELGRLYRAFGIDFDGKLERI